jgi:hypothetical protein
MDEVFSASMLTAARAELAVKTRQQIEEDTAYKWAARAIAANLNYEQTRNLRWLRDSADYLHEATEHAVFADSDGAVLRRVRQWMFMHGLH